WRPRDRRGLSRPLHTFDVGWADQPGAIEMMLSPSRHTDSPPVSPIRGTEAMLLLDLPTRLDARFATVAMADRLPSYRRLAGRGGWAIAGGSPGAHRATVTAVCIRSSSRFAGSLARGKSGNHRPANGRARR